MPKSPAWCATVNKKERATKAMAKLYRRVEDYDAEYQ
jgi:hypothetical protein